MELQTYQLSQLRTYVRFPFFPNRYIFIPKTTNESRKTNNFEAVDKPQSKLQLKLK